jgi:hypothetical protein
MAQGYEHCEWKLRVDSVDCRRSGHATCHSTFHGTILLSGSITGSTSLFAGWGFFLGRRSCASQAIGAALMYTNLLTEMLTEEENVYCHGNFAR